jgi:hypothetical protein
MDDQRNDGEGGMTFGLRILLAIVTYVAIAVAILAAAPASKLPVGIAAAIMLGTAIAIVWYKRPRK